MEIAIIYIFSTISLSKFNSKHFHSLFNRFRDFLPAMVSFEARQLLDVLVTYLLVGESDVSLLLDEPQFAVVLLISALSAAAMSGKIKAVLDGFLDELGSLDADLHLAPLGC